MHCIAMKNSRGLVRRGGDPGPAPPRATGCVPRSRVSAQVFRATSDNNDDILATACIICTGGPMSGEHIEEELNI